MKTQRQPAPTNPEETPVDDTPKPCPNGCDNHQTKPAANRAERRGNTIHPRHARRGEGIRERRQPR